MASEKKAKNPKDQAEQQPLESAAGEDKAGKGEKKALVKKGKRDKGKKRRFPFLLVFILILVIGAAAVMYFNFFSARDIVIETVLSTVNKLDPDYVRYAHRMEELDLREQELNNKETSLLKDEQTLAARRKQLDELEKELSIKEAANKPVYAGVLSDEKIAELKDLGKIYSQMDPAAAAEIMPKLYDITDMTAIIHYMNKISAATLLENLDSDLAAEITMKMLRN